MSDSAQDTFNKGVSMANAQAAKPKKTGCGGCLVVLIAVIAIVVIIGSVVGNGGPSVPSGNFTGNPSTLATAATATVDNYSTSPGVAGKAHARCVADFQGGRYCTVSYTVKEPGGINYSLEMVLPTTGIFKYAFTDPSVSRVAVTVYAPATTTGGKATTMEAFSLSCSRNAARQISWANITASGLRHLCNYFGRTHY